MTTSYTHYGAVDAPKPIASSTASVKGVYNRVAKALVALTMMGCITAAVMRGTTSFGGDGRLAHTESSDLFTQTSTTDYFEVDIDLVSFPSVRTFLERRGYDTSLAAGKLNTTLPSAIKLRVWPQRVAGDSGIDRADALGGFFAFSLQLKVPLEGTTSPDDVTYTCVVELATGTLVSVMPTDGGLSFDALKPFDPETLLLGGNVNSSEKGRTYAWRWTQEMGASASDDDGALRVVGGGRVSNSHDVQWSRALGRYWVPAEHDGFFEYDAKTGEKLDEYFNFTGGRDDKSKWSSVNHLTITADGDGAPSFAYINYKVSITDVTHTDLLS